MPDKNERLRASTTRAIQVTLLTQSQCGWCAQAEATITELSLEYPLTLTRIDVNSPEGRDLALMHGVLFAPGVLLDGVFFSYGRLSERKLRREVERRMATRSVVDAHTSAAIDR